MTALEAATQHGVPLLSVITERVVGSPNRLAVPLGTAARAVRFLGASWPVVRRAAGTATQVMVVVGMTRLRMTGRRAPGAPVASRLAVPLGVAARVVRFLGAS